MVDVNTHLILQRTWASSLVGEHLKKLNESFHPQLEDQERGPYVHEPSRDVLNGALVAKTNMRPVNTHGKHVE